MQPATTVANSMKLAESAYVRVWSMAIHVANVLKVTGTWRKRTPKDVRVSIKFIEHLINNFFDFEQLLKKSYE